MIFARMFSLVARARERVRARLGDESGVAMIIAIVALMVIGMLVAVAVAAAVQTNGSSRQDANKINAMEAAEAGLQAATYRMNMLRPDSSHCVGDTVALPSSYGECASTTYNLGNGATYSYYTSVPLSNGTPCVGNQLAGANWAQRCITATGTVNGVSARVQIRTSTYAAIPVFPVPGIIGLDKLTNGNNASITGWEATNGIFTVNNGVVMQGCELGPGATQSGGPNCSHLSSPLVLNPVDPGTSHQLVASDACGTPPNNEPNFQGTYCNDNYRITNGINGVTNQPHDGIVGIDSSDWDPANRILSIKHPNATITLTGGVYNFCELDAGNNTTIQLAPGVKAEIIIDSPEDPGSGCPVICPAQDNCAGQKTGGFNFANNDTWTNPSTDPLALQIYAYGWSNGQAPFNLYNNTVTYGLVYAPQSNVLLGHGSNNDYLTGAVAGRDVTVTNNFHFLYWNAAGGLQARATGVYWRTWWAQCRVSWSGDPASSCG